MALCQPHWVKAKQKPKFPEPNEEEKASQKAALSAAAQKELKKTK